MSTQTHTPKSDKNSPSIVHLVAVCVAGYSIFILAISFMATMTRGIYYPELTSMGLWGVMIAIVLYLLHVGLDVLEERIEEQKIRRRNQNREFDNTSISFIEGDRYDDWREYYADK